MAVAKYDLVIIGADAEGLAAASCAREGGKSVMVVRTGRERPSGFAGAGISNELWRTLGLQTTGFEGSAPARITLLTADGEARALTVADFARGYGETETGKLSASWPDFVERIGHVSVPGDGLNPRATDTAIDILDDYFDDDALKSGLACCALGALAFGGDEPGSAYTLRQVGPAFWPVREADDATSLEDALRERCRSAGVVLEEAAITAVQRNGGHGFFVTFGDDNRIAAKAVMASSVQLARACNFDIESPMPPAVRRHGAEAFIRINLDRDTDAQMPESGLYVLCVSCDELRAARSAMRMGALPENFPLFVDVRDGSIFVRAPYCPHKLTDADGEREWTGQDRQALGRDVFERLRKSLRYDGHAKSVDVRIDSYEPDADAPGALIAPDPLLPSIEGAARCALMLIANG